MSLLALKSRRSAKESSYSLLIHFIFGLSLMYNSQKEPIEKTPTSAYSCLDKTINTSVLGC